MKACVLSLFLPSILRHGAALPAPPELEAAEAAETVLAEHGIDETGELLSQSGLSTVNTFMASYDQKVSLMAQEVDAFKEKLTTERQSSMARLAEKKEGDQQKLIRAKQENQLLASSNKDLDGEVIRLQRQVAKKAAYLQKLQDANRERKVDMERIAKGVENIHTVFDKSIGDAKTKAEALIKAEATKPEALDLAAEDQDDSAEEPDLEERQVLNSARFGYSGGLPTFNLGKAQSGSGEKEELSSKEGKHNARDKEVSLLSLTISTKNNHTVNHTETSLGDFEPASLVQLLTQNLATLWEQETSAGNALQEEFKRRVKHIFQERTHLRKRQRALLAMQKKLTKYEGELDASTEKAKHAQDVLEEEIKKESNYLRKAKTHLHESMAEAPQ